MIIKNLTLTYSRGMHFLLSSQVKCFVWQVSLGQFGGSSLPSRLQIAIRIFDCIIRKTYFFFEKKTLVAYQSGETSQNFDFGIHFCPSAHWNRLGSWGSHLKFLFSWFSSSVSARTTVTEIRAVTSTKFTPSFFILKLNLVDYNFFLSRRRT